MLRENMPEGMGDQLLKNSESEMYTIPVLGGLVYTHKR